jgi:hypothetical protein
MDMSRHEIEDLVRYETATTPNTSVEHAVWLLHAHRAWLTEDRAERTHPSSTIDTGY